MFSFFKLIRFPNLLIIALTMYLVRYCLFVEYTMGSTTTGMSIEIIRELGWIDFTLNGFHFFLLVLSTILIAAGGYIINDYFDTKIDIINKPEKVIVGKTIKRRTAMMLHILLNAVAVMIGFYLAYKIGNYKLGLINLLTAGLLWFYSTTYKSTFLLGNIIISVLSALVPVVVGLFEPKIFQAENFLKSYFGYVLGYAIFAFVVSLIREIIKDMEDMEGDKNAWCRTLPIVLGIKTSKIIVVVITLITMAMLAYIQRLQYISNDTISFWYFMTALQIPFAALVFLVIRAKEKRNYAMASLLSKGIMLTGILSMIVFYFSLS